MPDLKKTISCLVVKNVILELLENIFENLTKTIEKPQTSGSFTSVLTYRCELQAKRLKTLQTSCVIYDTVTLSF